MAKSAAPSIPAHLDPVDIMIGWRGTKEIPGPANNPTIIGTRGWNCLVARPDVKSDDKVPNCAMAVGAAIVLCEFLKAGYRLEDLIDDGPLALDILAKQGIFVPLPARDQRLLAQGYNSYGMDARKNPARGDIMVIRRGRAWEGHVMFLVEHLGGGRWKCIGANQSDTTSYAEHHVSEALAIRRYVPPTIKDLRAANSTAIKRGDQQQAAGATIALVPPAVAIGKAIADTGAADPATLQPIVDQTGTLHTLMSTGASLGQLFVQNPWLIGTIGCGLYVWWLGRTGKLKRVKDYIANAVLSQHQTA